MNQQEEHSSQMKKLGMIGGGLGSFMGMILTSKYILSDHPDRLSASMRLALTAVMSVAAGSYISGLISSIDSSREENNVYHNFNGMGVLRRLFERVLGKPTTGSFFQNLIVGVVVGGIVAKGFNYILCEAKYSSKSE